MGDLVQFLKQKSIGEVSVLNPHLIEAKTSTNALDGYKLLVQHNILSIPLYDEQINNYTSFLDIMDILYFLTHDGPEGLNLEKLQSKTCGQLADFSKLDPFIKITETTNLIKVLQISSQDYRSLHRFPVVDQEGKLRGIVSQSLLVRYLEPHSRKFDFGTLSVGVLGLGLDKKVITVTEDDTVLLAIQKLKQHKISGVGIIDNNGILIGNFDATAVKYFGIGDKVFDALKVTMKEFLNSYLTQTPKDIEYPVCVTKQTIFHQAILKFNHHGVHRIFVVDEEKKPIGIISLVDVIELFFRHILIE